ncbi:MAG: ATP-binding protein [Xenococcaceae cyanobacterium]
MSNNVFAFSPFIPHGHCYLWKPSLVWLHVASDSLITLVYYFIPLLLLYFVRKRQDLPFPSIFILFSAFIIACGTTHLMEVWTLWHPTYWLSGGIKAMTAIISLLTAIEMVPTLPQALALPSPTALIEANEKLKAEIQQRIQLAEALQASEARLAAILDNADDAIISVDEDQRITLFNQGAEKTFGYTAGEVLDQPLDLLLPSHFAKIHRHHIASFGRAPETARKMGERGEVFGRRKDGTEFPAEASISKLSLEGKKVFTAILRDITEQRKRASEQIRTLNQDLEQRVRERTAQLEAINKELDSFSYSVSHDLRAPLRHINGFVNALKAELQSGSALNDPKVAHYLQVIHDSSQEMGHLIDGLLTLSRVGRRELIYSSVDLQKLVETAINLVNTPKNTGEERTREFLIDNLPTVRGDATLLQQVFTNLLSNAVKFSRDRRPARIEISSWPDGTVFVKDNGVGFQMEYADQLFGAFQRLHSKKQFEGTGIGLSIVQRIIHRHGGKIWAESSPDRGATFYFQLEQMEPGVGSNGI